MVALACILLLAGCASFVTPPRMANIQIRGPGNITKQFAITIDPSTELDTDIHLTDRYAVELFFQWLWYEKEDLESEYTVPKQDGSPSQDLTPWFLCKYRF